MSNTLDQLLDFPTTQIYKLSVAQYHALGEHGILKPEDRVELIHGVLLTKRKKTPLHSVANGLLGDVFIEVLPQGWLYQLQDPITLSDSEPEPDGCVIRGQVRDYATAHPRAQDVGLVVEVAEASLPFDRTVKEAVYAEARISIYWIVNLLDNTLEVHTAPSGPCEQPTYATKVTLGPTDEVPLFLDGQQVGRIRVRDLLP